MRRIKSHSLHNDSQSVPTDSVCYVEVAVGRLERLFHYRYPSALHPQRLQPGMRLVVSFGRRIAIAYFVRVVHQPSVCETKEVLACLDPVSPLSLSRVKLLQWMADYYFAPFGAVIQCALPKEGYKVVRRWEFTEAGQTALKTGAIKSVAIERILTRLKKGTFTDESRKSMGKEALFLERNGWIKPSWSIHIPKHWKEMPSQGNDAVLPAESPHLLNPDQQAVLDSMEGALKTGRFTPFLLHGVTGSGKTEIYLRLIGKALLENKGGIVLVPEIGLTPQLVSRFIRRFGETVAVLHSGISLSERSYAWGRIQKNQARIVIGARSALFAPMEGIGVIIVDEEHDPSYKQEEGVRYHARDAALMYGKMLNAVVVLGSATPSMESLHNVTMGKYKPVMLPKRVESRPLPTKVIVDLCARETWVKPFLTERLVEAIRQRLNRKEQVILFMNRRGHCPSLLCGACGRSWLCQNCSVALAFHKAKRRLLCHYCGFGTSPPTRCPDCHGTRLLYLGVGTEQIEEEIKGLFPEARVLRMDRDTTSKKAVYENIVAAMEAQAVDILIGTQMVAKGHDFPNVTLVGVICADHSLNLPDFRASERTLQLLVQVAGRAGRGASPGEVLLQTFQPSHPLFNILPDFSKGYDLERVSREEAGYPPYSRLILLRLCHPNESVVVRAAEQWATTLKSHISRNDAMIVLGPAPAPLARIRKEYRYQILLKGQNPAKLHALVCAGLAVLRDAPLNKVRLIVDVDPQQIS